MDRELSYYYDNCNNLTISDIRDFIISLCNIEIQKLNIKTKVDILFRANIKDYAGALTSNFEKDNSNKLVLPLKTDKYKLEINDAQIIEAYKDCKNKTIEVDSNIKIPKAFNFLSSVAALCAHEVRHAYQNEQIKDNIITNPETLLWLKSEIVRNRYEDIYEENYDTYFIEQDSNNYQSILAFDLLDKYSKIKEENLVNYKEYLKNHSIVFCQNIDIDTFYKELNHPLKKRVGIAYINELFNQIVNELPKEYIANSLLKYEYNLDGTKKTYLELMNEKEQYESNGENLDDLYKFIIKCDYNLQVQKYSLKLSELKSINLSEVEKEELKEKYIKKLKRAYATQLFSYKEMHNIIEKNIRRLNKELTELIMSFSKGEISFFEHYQKKEKLMKEKIKYGNIEKEIINYISDYKFQKEEEKKRQSEYYNSLEIIESYKEKNGILNIAENGYIKDVTDYNKLIAKVIKELNNDNLTESDKEYLLKVKEAIQMIYFPTTLNDKQKSK